MSARTRLLVCAAVGLTVAVVAAGAVRVAPLLGWDTTAAIFCGWLWWTIWPQDAESTERHVARDNPSRGLADSVLLVASLASLLAVGPVLAGAADAKGVAKLLLALLSVGSVVLSWISVHTVFTLRYAQLYYDKSGPGGIDFNDEAPPKYSDFGYLASPLA